MLPKETIKTERLELRFDDKSQDFEFADKASGGVYDYREIYLKNSNAKIGRVYIIKNNNELSIFLKKDYQRSGFGTEVCCAYISEIFKNTDIATINDVVMKSNLESIAFHKKFEIPIIEENSTFLRYSITKDQFMEKVKEFNDKKINPNVALDGFGKDIGEIFK